MNTLGFEHCCFIVENEAVILNEKGTDTVFQGFKRQGHCVHCVKIMDIEV